MRELRLARRLSIREVERRTGISRARLSQLEHGRLLPRDEWLDALRVVYGDEDTWYVPPAGVIAGVAIERDAV
jgi:transcriptional regulator with XRE-family HTH domain